MKKILSLITLISLSCCVYAADWRRYNSIYIDDQTMTKTEDSVRAWIISPNFPKSKQDMRTYTYQGYYMDAKCSEKQIAAHNTGWYNKYHKWEESPIANVVYVKVEPKTHNEVIFNALCIQEHILPKS